MFVDTHCHFCPGLDDGPKDMDEVIAMAQISWNEGIRTIAATAHQNERWPKVTPDRIVRSTNEVAAKLKEIGCDIELVPTAEVMINAETVEDWQAGKFLSYGDHKKYLMVEFPHGLTLDFRQMTVDLVAAGVRPVLAHVDRYSELLYGGDRVVELIRLGCVIQIATDAIADPADRQQLKALRDWARRGIIHVVGSDAHSPRRRRPMMRAAHVQLSSWTNQTTANQICMTNGLSVVRGTPLVTPRPKKRRRLWL